MKHDCFMAVMNFIRSFCGSEEHLTKYQFTKWVSKCKSG